LLDNIEAPEGIPALLSNALTQAGGMQGILAKLQAGGLGSQVSSWVGTGGKLPISGARIQTGLGDQHVQQIAASLGIPADKVLAFLSQHLSAPPHFKCIHGHMLDDLSNPLSTPGNRGL
jgi:uncharacterized protein YidB (DUF937 family)